MKYGYLIAYSDDQGKSFTEKEPWIHPSHPMNKRDILREHKFVTNVVGAKVAIIFRVEIDNVPEYIDWDFASHNEVKPSKLLPKL